MSRKRKRMLLWLGGIMVLVALGSGVTFLILQMRSPAAEAEPTPTPEETPEEEPAEEEEANLGDVQVAITIEDLGEGDLFLDGLNSSWSVWVPIPSNWTVLDVQANLNYVASPVLHPDRAAFTVLSNGQAVTSLRPVSDGGQHEAVFRISPDNVYQGLGFLLEFKGYLPITADICEKQQTSGQWLTILSDTRLFFTANYDRSAPTLETMAQAIVVQDTLTPEPPAAFVLPDTLDANVLTAAARIASRLGREVNIDRMPFEVVLASAAAPEKLGDTNLVVLGLPDANPLILAIADDLPAPLEGSGFMTKDGQVAPPSHGVVQIISAPWNTARRILLVSGGSEEGLRLAGRAFAVSSTFETLIEAYEFIEHVDASRRPAAAVPWLNTYTSFAQLQQQTRKIEGLGIVPALYTFGFPAGWMLTDGAQLVLDLSYSPRLDAGAHVTLYINGVLVGTQEIEQGAEQARLTFDWPVAQINETLKGGQIQANIEVANLIVTDGCEQMPTEAAWTQILDTSHFVTEVNYRPVPDLQLYPYPFVNDQFGAPVAIVVPPAPTEAELDAALSVAAALGSRTVRDYDLSLVTTDQLTEQMRADSHLIVLGAQARQPLIEDVLGMVPAASGDGVYQDLQNKTVGTLREVVSPWNVGRVVLLAFGETAAGFEKAGRALFGTAPLASEQSTLVFIDGEEEASK